MTSGMKRGEKSLWDSAAAKFPRIMRMRKDLAKGVLLAELAVSSAVVPSLPYIQNRGTECDQRRSDRVNRSHFSSKGFMQQCKVQPVAT